MKTKHTPKLIVLILSVMMIVSMFCVMTVSASAAETSETSEYTSPAANEAKIYSQGVNLGGDISMKYYVEIGTGVEINKLKLQTVFLGEADLLAAADEPVVMDGKTLYVYTLTSVTPQCLGDDIDAQLIYNGTALTNDYASKNDYSVADNLVAIYDDSNEATKQLIIDTLEYGAAAQVYAGYKTGALVTADIDFLSNDTNDVEEIPASFPTGTKVDGETTLVEANVLFSYMNFLKFRFTGADASSTATVGGAEAKTWTEEPYFYAQATKGVEPFNFDEKYEVELGNINLSYSINDYCYAVSQKSNDDNMKALAKALYNYGRSAEALKHAENREHTNVTYVVEGATIKATCPACGNIGQITLVAPESLVYDGTDKVVTCTGEIEYLEAPVVNYEGDRKNVTQDGFTAYILVDGVRVELNVELKKADQAPLTITGMPETVAYCDGVNLDTTGGSTGGSVTWAVTEGNHVVSVNSIGYVNVNGVGNFTITATMAGNDNYNDVTATWAGTAVKGTPDKYDAPTGVTATYGTKLSDVVLVNPTGNNEGTWSWMTEDENTLVGDVTADGNTFYAKFIPQDKNYNTMENIPVIINVSKSEPSIAFNNYDPSKDYDGNALEVTIDDLTITGAYDGELTFTWYKNSVAEGNKLEGAPKDAGTYYVVASIAETTNAAAASATSSAITISKANPSYTVPTGLTATYGQTLADVTLPTVDGGVWTWNDDSTTSVGNAGSNSFNVTFTPTDTTNYKTATESVKVDVRAADIEGASAETIGNQVSDNGNAIEPKPVLKFNGVTLTEGTDYTLTYKDNTVAGIATITVTGKGNFEGTKELTFTIVDHVHSWTYEASGATITATCSGEGDCPIATVVTATVTATDGTYTGSAITTAEVEYSEGWIEAGLGELDITYANNVNVGTATATISVDRATASVAFEIKKDPKTDEIDGEWVTIEQEPYVW